ncbi:futalosine hydrolase, partial [Streptomyces sp. SID2119]|nr:futalosine hydrolase [Streptomyces sp. SID2119]
MRVLVVTAVPVERDAVTRAFAGTPEVLAVPGAELHRSGAFDVLAGGAGPAAAAAAAAFALASSTSQPYGLVVSAGIGGGFAPA